MTDLRFAIRMLSRKPGLACLAILATAFGIGLTTAMFSIVNGALLRGLPFPDAQRIQYLSLRDVERQRDSPVPEAAFRELVDRQQVFEDLGAFAMMTANVVGPDRTAERFTAARITTNMLGLLRVPPARGRDFVPADGAPGAPPVVIIGHKIWIDVFGGVMDVIGSTLRINGTPTTVVGVMPPSFRFPLSQDLWLPLVVDRTKPPSPAPLQVVGRLKDDLLEEQAQAEMSILAARLGEERPNPLNGQTVRLGPYTVSLLSGGTSEMIYTMLAASLGVLLIACVNVANLMLARGADRTREMAVRASVGASRWRVVRQLMAEVLVLTAVGAAAAVALAQIGIAFFNRAIAESLPPFWIDIRIDFVVLSFVTAVTVAAVAVAGIVPALRTSTVDLSTAMSEEGRGTSARIGGFSHALVIIEMALSCGLAVASALIIEGIVRASTLDFDFAMNDVWHARLVLPPQDYPDEGARRRALEDILAGLDGVQGAVSVAAGTELPIGGAGAPRSGIKVAGQEAGDSTRPATEARLVSISPHYFDVLRVTPLNGRAFTDHDRADAAPVAIVNASFARAYLSGSAIGRQVALTSGAHQEWRTVVGVVPDLGFGRLATDPMYEAIYLPVTQTAPASLRLLVQMGTSTTSLAASARDVIQHVDPDLPLFDTGTVEQRVRFSTWPTRVFGAVFVAFGIAGLVLAAIGLYGVIAHAVTRRTREIGVRMAMGAEKGEILRMVLTQGLAQILIGAALGVWLALVLAASLEFLLFGVSPRDPRIFALTLAVLIATGLLACLAPARRAASVDPMTALRHD